ncbi:MAG: hypothetical protein LQ352_002254 [Teloschistes flavicans]|nr:MAG: hypothetical protein LQ352_002254 [Teloschistes flavicans]
MYLLKAKILLLAAATLDTAIAHTTFTNFYVDGAPQGDGTCVRMNNDIPKATWPVRPIDSQDMACGVDGNKGVARICPANSGSQLTFNFRDWPDGSQPGSLDKSHMGTCSVYMKKVDNAAADNNAAGPGWFKIFEEDYDNSTAQWCTSKIMANDGKLSVQIPSDLAGGYYLVRPELLALHQADKTPPDPQFYVGCAQVFLQSTGSAVPKDTVSIPGYVSMQDPAMTFHIWDAPKQLYFPQFSPPTYKSGSSKRDIKTRADQLKQTFGLKPANCIMENDNWCGLTLPSYSNENGCWATSQKCSDQTTTCYSSAGPTGSKNCKNWEDYCTSIRQACGSGNFNGPPSASSFIPTAPARLSVTGSNDPSSDNTQDQSSGSSGDKAEMGTSTPAGGDNSVKGGSVDTCGGQGGLKPQDLLSSPTPQHLIPYKIHQNPEPVYATIFHPSFTLENATSALYAVSLRALPIRLLSPFSPSIIASYPLVSITTEEYIAPHSLLFSPYDPNTLFAGSFNLITTFDINRNGQGPVARMPTIPSKRSKVVGGAGGIKGIVSALGMSPEGILAAGTFSRWIGLYDGQGRGGSVGAFEVGENAVPGRKVDGAGTTQVLWSNDGRYLCVAERCSDQVGVWDIRGTGKKLASLRGRKAVTNQRMSVDLVGNEVWAGGVDGMVRVWGDLGMKEGMIDPAWEFNAHDGTLFTLSRNGKS